MLQYEATNDSLFDPLRLRRSMWEQVERGEAKILAQYCSFARIIWIQTNGTNVEPPWALWGRIFQWLGPCRSGKPWRIFWLPAPEERTLPGKGKKVGPAHVNGGYCYPCRPDCIIIYRYEEATRVLVHELLHASCLDPQGAELTLKEATTETWAELFMVAVCSGGNKKEGEKLWCLQSQWIADQNSLLRRDYGVKSSKDYSWRYTLGREDVLKTLHIELPSAKRIASFSSRLTSPALCL